MRRVQAAALALLTLLAGGCGGDVSGPLLGGRGAAPLPLGVYEISLAGIGSADPHSSIRPVVAPTSSPRGDLVPAGAGISFEQVASSSFSDGPRGAGGQRYVSFTYRVRNGTGVTLNNLTLLLVTRAGTLPGSPLSRLLRFDGSPANAALATLVAPTGAVAMSSDLVTMQALYPDVIQVLQQAEVSAIAAPAEVTGIFPYGYVVRSADPEAPNRTLPAASSPNQYDGVLTVAFRLPLQPSVADDVWAFTFQVLAVQDGETRLTESIEEAQDSGAVRRLQERAAALGATTVTILAGSPAAAPEVADYPGQRQICTVRIAGSAAQPVTYLTTPAGYTRLALLRPGESPHFCKPWFRSGSAELPALGVPYPLTLRPMDRYGNVLGSVVDTVSLAQLSGPAASVGPSAPLASGQAVIPVTWLGKGTSLLRASGARIRGQRLVEIAAAATLEAAAPLSQAALAGTAVPTPPAVLVRDLAGQPLAGVPVTFSIASGGGQLSGASTLSDAAGVARAGSWVLGTPAALNTVVAQAAGASATATFSASGCSGSGAGFRLTLCFTSPLTATQRAAFEGAAVRWQEVVSGELADAELALPQGGCGGSSPAFHLAVDDLLVFAGIESIDGAGGIVGSAAPCVFRAGSGLPVVGVLRLDAADSANLRATGLLGGVALHELGHVLGIGSRWPAYGLLLNPSSPGGPAADTWYSGAGGIAGFDLIGGAAYTGGHKVPVENTGPGGTINAHWRESLLASELMTGYVNAGAMPLSLLSVRSLTDLGYAVDASHADPFLLVFSAGTGLPAGATLPLLNDVAATAEYRVDGEGRVTRIR